MSIEFQSFPAPCKRTRPRPTGLDAEILEIRRLRRAFDRAGSDRRPPRLAGNCGFLEDGRVIAFERRHGDSRYLYGQNGFQFWVHASGRMCANDGLFFLFLPPQEGREPQIAFFLGLRQPDGTYLPVSLLPVPYLNAGERVVADRYTVFGHDAAWFVVETADLAAGVRVFLDQTHPQAVSITFSLHIESLNEYAQEVLLSTYMNPLFRHQFNETSEDRWFKKISLGRDSDPAFAPQEPTRLPPFLIEVNEDRDRSRSFTNLGIVGRVADCERLQNQVCTSRTAFIGGPRAGLAEAGCLRSGRFERQVRSTVFNDNAIVGDLHRFRLRAGAVARFDYCITSARPDRASDRPLHAAAADAPVDRAVARVREQIRRARHDLRMQVFGSRLPEVNADTLNKFFPYLIRQVAVCAQTRGFMQPSPNSLIGIRDVFQAVEGHLYDRPDEARAKILEGLSFVLTSGRCPRQYSLPVHGRPGAADLREFIDQGCWVVSTLHTYLQVTGDWALLEQPVGYHELDTKDPSRIRPAADADTVLEHLIRIMRYLSSRRDPQSGLLRALYGDWNDAVDGLGTSHESADEFGSGVSAMASLQFYRNCGEMVAILERFGSDRYAGLRREYQRVQRAVRNGLLRYAVLAQDGERRIVHGWGDSRRYFVGSFADSDGQARDSLTSNAFWVLSGMLEQDPSLRPHVLAALRRLDSRFGLKTFEPGFAGDAPGVGRVCRLPIGTAENGATYVHAALFGIMALFAMNEPQAAWRQIVKILPFAPHQEGLSHSPFVMPNSYAWNPELNLTGQNMNDWQTGSSNALLKTLVRDVFGFRPDFDVLRIAPASWCPFDRFEFCGLAHGQRVCLRFGHAPVSRRRFRINGRDAERPGTDQAGGSIAIAYDALKTTGENLIEVIQPEGPLRSLDSDR